MTKFFTQRMIIFLPLSFPTFAVFLPPVFMFLSLWKVEKRGEGRTTIETHHLLIFSSLFAIIQLFWKFKQKKHKKCSSYL